MRGEETENENETVLRVHQVKNWQDFQRNLLLKRHLKDSLCQVSEVEVQSTIEGEGSKGLDGLTRKEFDDEHAQGSGTEEWVLNTAQVCQLLQAKDESYNTLVKTPHGAVEF